MKKETYYDLRKNYDELQKIIENEPEQVIKNIYQSVLDKLRENYELIGDILIAQDRVERASNIKSSD